MLTGKPDAGNPPVRFGGRSGAIQCAIPTPIQSMREHLTADVGNEYDAPRIVYLGSGKNG